MDFEKATPLRFIPSADRVANTSALNQWQRLVAEAEWLDREEENIRLRIEEAELRRQAEAEEAKKQAEPEAARRRAAELVEEQQRAKNAQMQLEEIEALKNKIDVQYTNVRDSVERRADIHIFRDILNVMPPALSWTDLLSDAENHKERIRRIGVAREANQELLNCLREGSPRYLSIAGRFRELLEPQCAVVIGRALFEPRNRKVAPTYIAALLDLELVDDALSVGKTSWAFRDEETHPGFLTKAFYRAASR